MIIIKVLIAGSRSIKKYDLTSLVPQNTDLIICGGADGIDKIAEEYADLHKISKLVLRPKYTVYGKAAPIKRNEYMVDMADYVLIIWDGISKGSAYTLEYANKKGKYVKLVLIEKS